MSFASLRRRSTFAAAPLEGAPSGRVGSERQAQRRRGPPDCGRVLLFSFSFLFLFVFFFVVTVAVAVVIIATVIVATSDAFLLLSLLWRSRCLGEAPAVLKGRRRCFAAPLVAAGRQRAKSGDHGDSDAASRLRRPFLLGGAQRALFPAPESGSGLRPEKLECRGRRGPERSKGQAGGGEEAQEARGEERSGPCSLSCCC